MLNKSRPLSGYKANSGKNKRKKFMQFDHDASNSMFNHPGNVTITAWIFLKFLPVVGIIEI